MAPTPYAKSNHATQMRTPQSRHRLHFPSTTPAKTPNPHLNPVTAPAGEHPVEVIGRIRDYPDRKEKPISVLQANPDKHTVRVRADIGYRDFTLDGISMSEEEDLDSFYKKFIQSRINGVRLGDKCTIMMYGPTGSGKSHTMFGCAKQQGIVYRSLRDILGEGEEGGSEERVGVVGAFVQVSVMEIYNEEIYDLLPNHGVGGLGFGWPKGGSASKVRLEVMGKKAKNATFISGTEAGKISKEIQKVEKRRIVKNTLCNERSSRSHCMIILDVPTVGGRLMLVDMAGSENIEQAGQNGFEAKMQTAKINQGNIALKRVVESIANGDSHVPFRDSKLTMLLQDSFEDDRSKILMILCASPDPKEIHKTICTLEYGAKAKCIVRGPLTPVKDKNGAEEFSSTSRIAAMDQYICKLQMENKIKEKERNEAHKQLIKKEEEVAALRALLVEKGSGGASEEEIDLKVNERTRMLKLALERKLEECQRMTEEFVELERKRMEERIIQQQEEVEMLRKRLEEIESEIYSSRDGNVDADGRGLAKRLGAINADDMVKSMDIDMGDQEPYVRDIIKPIQGGVQDFSDLKHLTEGHDGFASKYGDRVCLSTVFEEEEVECSPSENSQEREIEKVIVEDKRVCLLTTPAPCKFDTGKENDTGEKSRILRIQNIFTLCGNNRELSHHMATPGAEMKTVLGETTGVLGTKDSEAKIQAKIPLSSVENIPPLTPNSCISKTGDALSPVVAPHLSSTPFITLRRN